MSIDRRHFLINTGLLGLATHALPAAANSRAPQATANSGALQAAATSGAPPTAATSGAPLKILVLGGTGFIGPHTVRHALERGHELTLFNRGKSGPGMFPQAKHLVGDRDGGLQALERGEWDAVIDLSGYVPRVVRDSAQLLRGRVKRYLFVSTMSVYDFAAGQFPLGVGSKLKKLGEPGSEDTRKHYGELKVLCEQAVADAYGQRATVVRPIFVCGPGDHTQRYTWWVERIHRGGDIVAPGNPLDAIGIIDVGDLARFFIHLLERDTAGTYNATGPAGILGMGGLLESIRATTAAEVRFHWLPARFLAQRVGGREMPLWLSRDGGYRGLLGEYQSSVAAGLRYTTLAETAIATHRWHQSLPPAKQAFNRAGLAPEKEAAILREWRESAAG